jgi:hypothetical protein
MRALISRFLVAGTPVRDLLLCAKYLFVAAIFPGVCAPALRHRLCFRGHAAGPPPGVALIFMTCPALMVLAIIMARVATCNTILAEHTPVDPAVMSATVQVHARTAPLVAIFRRMVNQQESLNETY